ncbi:hypothetical protein [Methanosarcina sp. KYL-1]|uniref:hypothetical protein n=1 Tax=Methanosarcina sp. KYL-1 TaxID=2602068 RepID=UPI0021010F87|nr:hypothetical protein [Methanosarcina sp. KYL-1]
MGKTGSIRKGEKGKKGRIPGKDELYKRNFFFLEGAVTLLGNQGIIWFSAPPKNSK